MDNYEFRVKATKGRARLIHPKITDQVTEDQLLEGDMLLTREQLRELNASLISGSLEGVKPKDPPRELNGVFHNAKLNPNLRWPDNTLAFELLRHGQGHDKIRRTLKNLEKKLGSYQGAGSCVKFVERQWGDRVQVVWHNDRCYSLVGKSLGHGTQYLNLGGGCMDTATIEHEFLHALGVHHTQSRHDRDEHVKIIWENIIGGKQNNNFNKYKEDEVTHFGIPYDYRSVMHYEADDFTKNGGLTIVRRDRTKPNIFGNENGVTDSDIKLVRKMYYCDGDCTIIKGKNRGRKCVFPFIYKGKRYDFCIASEFGGGNFWCSMDTYYNGGGNWGYCNKETCPLEP